MRSTRFASRTWTTTTTTTTTILPIASLRFISRKMTHLNERIIPHLGGLGRDPSLCCSHSPQPALLSQETSLHGVPAPEDTPKRTARSGNWDTRREHRYGGKVISTLRGGTWESLLLGPGSTESTPVLRSRWRYYNGFFWYCGIDSCTPASSAVLRNRFRSRFRYYGMD